MHVGIAGPIETASLTHFFESESYDVVPVGMGPSDITYLVQGLVSKGYKVSIYTLSPDIDREIVMESPKIKILFGPFRAKGRDRMKDFFWQESEAIKKFILEDNPDIVHAHWVYEFAMGALKSHKKTLITVCDWPPTILWYSQDLYRLVRLFLGMYVISRGRAFSVVSPHIQERLYQLKRTRYPIIPNMLEDSQFSSTDRVLQKENPVLISINNGFGPLKNVDVLLYAFRQVHETIPTSKLLLVGHDFGFNGIAHKWACGHNTDLGVEFVGEIPHKAVLQLLERCDLLVHPSKEESFGMSLLEAMAKRTPVVGGKTSGAVPWVLDGGRSGVLLDISSPSEIAKEVLQLLTNDERWQMYSKAGYKYASQNFRLTKVVDEYVNAYEAVLHGVKA